MLSFAACGVDLTRRPGTTPRSSASIRERTERHSLGRSKCQTPRTRFGAREPSDLVHARAISHGALPAQIDRSAPLPKPCACRYLLCACPRLGLQTLGLSVAATPGRRLRQKGYLQAPLRRRG
jgi:hypothetical protein